jgi:hypothetical protein
MTLHYTNLPPCGMCRERPAQICCQFDPRDLDLSLCWQCAKATELLELRLCCLCATRHALALLRDVAELEVGYERARARYRDALKRVGL